MISHKFVSFIYTKSHSISFLLHIQFDNPVVFANKKLFSQEKLEENRIQTETMFA